jgi:hypothetical protein
VETLQCFTLEPAYLSSPSRKPAFVRHSRQTAPSAKARSGGCNQIIVGQAPGLKVQEDLFTDELGHGKPPLMALVAYCDYAVIYRRSPVGLPVPAILKQAKLGDQEENLNRLLQELAWDAVLQHPLSGIQR